MIATSFPEENMVLDPPPGMTLDECSCLPVLQTRTQGGAPVVVSCWKMTHEELREIQRTGRVYVLVYGVSMPPIAVEGMRPFAGEQS